MIKTNVRVKLKKHYQSGIVNKILEDERKQRELFRLLKESDIIKNCVKIK